MSAIRFRIGAFAVFCAAFSACGYLPSAQRSRGNVGCEVPACRTEQTLEAVACDIDHIEKHIDLWGSITTKHPDVWGSARMTKYQQEVEKVFALEATDPKGIDTKVTAFQGARARTDQAFLAQAVAINAALSGRSAALLDPDPVTVVTGTRTITNNLSGENTGTSNLTTNVDAAGKATTTKGSETKGTAKAITGDNNEQKIITAVPKSVDIPKSATIPQDFQTFVSSTMDMKRNPATIAGMPGFGDSGLRVEPTLILDQKKRFLDHLNQIRRVNEGDDTSDSPGYALYMVRVPVSVLPGRRTDTGHGAEITMSLKPILGDDLLPATFRNLVINDLVDQFSELTTVLLNDDRKLLRNLLPEVRAVRESEIAAANEVMKGLPDSTQPVRGFLSVGILPAMKSTIYKDGRSKLEVASRKVKPKYTAARPSRNAEYAFPMTHLNELFGPTFVESLVVAAVARYQSELEQDKVIHLHEVRAAVREQIVAGYRFLTTGNAHVWSLCTQDLARAIRDVNGNAGGAPTVREYQKQYDDLLGRELDRAKELDSDRLVVKALGWAILLESALLTEQLVRDMKETATHKGCACPAEGWQDYFHPEPSPTSRRAFNDYVACRWPMYTFAVDPVTEQQNVQDTFSQRREMQLALALSFASGNLSANSFTRAARRLEADYQTIDLNRTVVGFSHGDNTFGWRFYPRFQTPEIPGTLKVLGRDLLGRRAFMKSQEVRQRHLEPGQRECVALVIMPSFVPFAELNVSSSWFNLNDPKRKSHSTKETVKLSHRLQTISAVCPKGDEGRYLAGEFGRLQAKAQMLAARLPLQDMKFPVPYENTLGGFEFFNSGISDLSPQLRGWYGAEGYEGNQLELFLMGDNFSVANSSVIVGGKPVTPRLISRQVASITIPAGATASVDKAGLYSKSGKFIDVRLATPYGVGGPLRIPYLGEPEKAPAPTEVPPAPTLRPVGDGQVAVTERDTDLVLSGENFTADTRAFAGGKTCSVEVLGKTVVKVTVPKTVVPLRNDNGLYVEIKVATPSGVSNVIAIPVVQIPAPAVVPAPKAGATFTAPDLTIAFQYKGLGIVAADTPNWRPPSLRAKVAADAVRTLGLKDGDMVTVTLKEGDAALPTFDVVFNRGELADISSVLAPAVLKAWATRFGPENSNPPVPVKLTATLKPKAGSDAVDLTGGLTIRWLHTPPEKQ